MLRLANQLFHTPCLVSVPSSVPLYASSHGSAGSAGALHVGPLLPFLLKPLCCLQKYVLFITQILNLLTSSPLLLLHAYLLRSQPPNWFLC